MNRMSWLLSLLFLLAGPLDSVCQAGIPIVWGHGESVTKLGSLPDIVRQEIVRDLGHDVEIGYMYSRVHVFWADLWTWNGKHVLFSGNRYWELKADQWQQVLGQPVTQKFPTPWYYRFPLGLTLIVALIALSVTSSVVFPSEQKQLKKLFKDTRYTSVLETVFPENSPGLATSADPQRVDSAVATLVDQGISESKARRNLEKLLSAIFAAHEMQINEALAAVTHFIQNGPPEKGIEILEQLIPALPDSDPRQATARQMLTELQAQPNTESTAGDLVEGA